MFFFKQKKDDISLVVTCVHCGTRADSSEDRCKNCKQKVDVQVSEAGTSIMSPVSNELENCRGLLSAPVRDRVLAAIIDHTGIFLLAFTLEALSLYPLGHYFLTGHSIFAIPGIAPNLYIGLVFLLCIGASAIPFMYFAWFESAERQATPGKRIMGLKVVGLHSMQMGFPLALTKSVVQYIVLYVISIIAAVVSALIFIFIPPIADQPYIFCILEGIMAIFCLCVPVFRSGKQSLVDRMLGRMVVKESTFTEELWSEHARLVHKQEGRDWGSLIGAFLYWVSISAIFLFSEAFVLLAGLLSGNVLLDIFYVSIPVVLTVLWLRAGKNKWQYVRLGLLVSMLIAISVGLIAAVPYDYEMIQKSGQAMPLAEKGLTIDPLGCTTESRKYIHQAYAQYPDLWVTYMFLSKLARIGGPNSLAEDLTRKSCVVAQDKTLTMLASYLEKKQQYERALALYREEKARTLKRGDRESYDQAASGEAGILLKLKQKDEAGSRAK